MTCEKFAQMLDNYENLTNEEKSLMSEHAAQCETCRRELEFMRSIIDAVQTLPEMKVPDDFLENLNKRIDAEVKPVNRTGIAGHIKYNWQKYSAFAACLVLVAVIGANYNTLLDSMNDSDDGVVSTVTTMSSPAPGSDSSNTIESAVSPAPVNDSETALSDSANNADSRANITGNTSGASSRSERTSRSKENTNSGRYSASSNTGNSSTAGAKSVTPYTGYTSPQITPAETDPQTVNESAADSASTADAAVTAESTADISPETKTLPRSTYVESNSTPVSDTSEDASAAGDEANPYAINPAADTSGYAVAPASGAEEGYSGGGSSRTRNSGGSSIGTDIYSGEAEDNDLGYVLNPNNMIVVKGEDFATAFDIICRYASDSYSNYFMVTSDDIYNMLAALDEAGVRYHENISADNDKITFRISID